MRIDIADDLFKRRPPSSKPVAYSLQKYLVMEQFILDPIAAEVPKGHLVGGNSAISSIRKPSRAIGVRRKHTHTQGPAPEPNPKRNLMPPNSRIYLNLCCPGTICPPPPQHSSRTA